MNPQIYIIDTGLVNSIAELKYRYQQSPEHASIVAESFVDEGDLHMRFVRAENFDCLLRVIKLVSRS